jgi:hypothetical protein
MVAGCLSAAPLVTAAPVGGATHHGSHPPVVAPYLDMGSHTPSRLYAAIRGSGLSSFTAGFVIGQGCTPVWDDQQKVSADPEVSHVIAKARHLGATPIISFGGAAQPELARSCHSTGRLTAAYRSVVKRFHVTHVDFDIEGDAISSRPGTSAHTRRALAASIKRRFAAIRALRRTDKKLVVLLTIPTAPTGLDANQSPGSLALLKAAKHDKARVDLVNLMTMDYFDGSTTAMGTAAISAARGARTAMRTLWPHTTYADIGITPMIGLNDDTSETFTISDAHAVRHWAAAHGIGRLAFWALQRDGQCATPPTVAPDDCSGVVQPPLAFTKAFTHLQPTR